MENMLNRLGFLMTTIWVGSLWSMLMVTSVLFNKISSTFIAGAIAADMFTFLNYAGMLVLTLIIILGFKLNGMKLLKKSFFWIALIILLLVLISFFGINPFLETLKLEALPREVMEGVFADRYKSWHGIASVAYLFQCFLGLALVLKMREF